jgi:hypothetical protein
MARGNNDLRQAVVSVAMDRTGIVLAHHSVFVCGERQVEWAYVVNFVEAMASPQFGGQIAGLLHETAGTKADRTLHQWIKVTQEHISHAWPGRLRTRKV